MRNTFTRKSATQTWAVAHLVYDIPLVGEGGEVLTPAVAFVIDLQAGHVVAFRVAPQEGIERTLALAIYDALTASRQPGTADSPGVFWQIPEQISSTPDMPLTHLGETLGYMSVELNSNGSIRLANSNIWPSIQQQWYAELKDRRLSIDRFSEFLDQRLFRLQGYGPHRMMREQRSAHSHLVGFNRDPVDLFPDLRSLLPLHAGMIREGAVELNGLHYMNDLLRLWPGRAVKICRSEDVESRAWIIGDQGVLCEADAIELRRQDGTYRPWRTGG